MAGFFAEVTAAFVGTGAALVALRFLSETFVGHWFAKGLVRYTATVETQELKKRVAIERLHHQRSDFIARLMERAARCNAVLVSPISMTGAPQGAGPELIYMQRFGEISKELQTFANDAVSATHLFDREEKLIQLAVAWSLNMQQRANYFHDGVVALVANDEYWTIEPVERRDRLLNLQREHLLAAQPDPNFLELLDRCRVITGAAE